MALVEATHCQQRLPAINSPWVTKPYGRQVTKYVFAHLQLHGKIITLGFCEQSSVWERCEPWVIIWYLPKDQRRPFIFVSVRVNVFVYSTDYCNPSLDRRLSFYYPILYTRTSVCPFVCFLCSSVTVRPPPLDSETGWTGELWSKTNLLNWQKYGNSIFFSSFFFCKKYVQIK